MHFTQLSQPCDRSQLESWLAQGRRVKKGVADVVKEIVNAALQQALQFCQAVS